MTVGDLVSTEFLGVLRALERHPDMDPETRKRGFARLAEVVERDLNNAFEEGFKLARREMARRVEKAARAAMGIETEE